MKFEAQLSQVSVLQLLVVWECLVQFFCVRGLLSSQRMHNADVLGLGFRARSKQGGGPDLSTLPKLSNEDP